MYLFLKHAFVNRFMAVNTERPHLQVTAYQCAACVMIIMTVYVVFYCGTFLGTKMTAMLEQYRERIRSELDRVVDFWLKYSHDEQYG